MGAISPAIGRSMSPSVANKKNRIMDGIPRTGLLELIRNGIGTIGVSVKSKPDNSTTATYFVLPNTDATNHVRYSTISLADCALAGTPTASINVLFTAGGAGTKIVLGSGTYEAPELSSGSGGINMTAANQQLIGVLGGEVVVGSATLNDHTVLMTGANTLVSGIKPINGGSGFIATIYPHPGAGNKCTVDSCIFSPTCPGIGHIYQDNGYLVLTNNILPYSPNGELKVRLGGGFLAAFNTIGTKIYLENAGNSGRVFANVFSGVSGRLLISAASHTSGSIDFCGNLCFPPDSASEYQQLNLNAAITGDVDGNYFSINPQFVSAMLFGAGQTIGTNHYTQFPGVVSNKRSGYLCFSVDDYNTASYDTWGYLYGTDGTDGLVALINSFGGRLTWYPNTASIINEDPETKLAWLVSQGVEIGSHTVTHSDLTFSGKIFDVVKGAETITVDRAADTITLSGGGSITAFRSKTLAQIKTALEGLGATVTPVAAYDSGVVGTLSQSAKGEAIANVSAGAELTLLRGDATEGYIKCEVYDAIDTLEEYIGVGTVKSFAYPFGTGRTDADLKTKLRTGRNGQLTSARSVNFDGSSPAKVNGLDRYALATTSSARIKTNITSGDESDDIRAYTHSLCAYLAENGGYAHIYGHSASELTLANWTTILTEVAKWDGRVTIDKTSSEVMAELLSIATDTDGVLSYTWTNSADYRLLSTSVLKNLGVAPFVDGDGDQYDADGYKVWDDTYNITEGHWIDGVDIGAYAYGGSNKIYLALTIVSGTGPADWVVKLPAAPDIIAILGLDSTWYDASAVPKEVAFLSLGDDVKIFDGNKGRVVIFSVDKSADAERIHRYTGPSS